MSATSTSASTRESVPAGEKARAWRVGPVQWLALVAVIGGRLCCSQPVAPGNSASRFQRGCRRRQVRRCPTSIPTPLGVPLTNCTTGPSSGHRRFRCRSRRWRRMRTRPRWPRSSTRDCKLTWPTLAGIGMVESRHGTYGGATIAPNGDVTPPIPRRAAGRDNGNMEIMDTDGGELDGDPTLDRAMGPMQFIPETWRCTASMPTMTA